MQTQDVIDSFMSISILTGKMVNAAETGDWDGLAMLEQNCRAQVEELKLMKEGTLMQPASKKEKVEVIKKILADDARIRELTEPWMKNLHSILVANHKGKLVEKTYKQDDWPD
jgi:flagellar protein FliT